MNKTEPFSGSLNPNFLQTGNGSLVHASYAIIIDRGNSTGIRHVDQVEQRLDAF